MLVAQQSPIHPTCCLEEIFSRVLTLIMHPVQDGPLYGDRSEPWIQNGVALLTIDPGSGRVREL